jgi:precorrin-6B methylase 2
MNWQSFLKNEEIIQKIRENKGQNVASLALKWANKKDDSTAFILTQIQGRAIAERKIPSWTQHEELVYPDKTAMEQCSSELTARIKSELLEDLEVADLTGGLGIDSYFISLKAKRLLYVEPNLTRFEIAQHNFNVLGVKNVDFYHSSAEEFLSNQELSSVDCIYIDPSRRNENKNRVFLLKDMQPDLRLLIDYFKPLNMRMLIKLSPMLDIQSALKELECVKNIYIISVDDECKELLFDIDFKYEGQTSFKCVNITNEKTQGFEYQPAYTENDSFVISEAINYIYDPFASLNKAGGFKPLANYYGLNKISNNTHLFTSENLLNNFFGNCFEVLRVDDFSSKEFIAIANKKGVIKIRNFRMSQSEIEKKTKITYGPDYFYFFYSDASNKMKVATTKKVY